MARHSIGSVSSSPMVLMDHLRELQRRLIVIAAVFIAGSGAAYAYQAPLIKLLLDPLAGQKLVYLNPAGGFNFIFMISIYAGLVLAVPFMIHQLYCFVRPLLSKKVQHYSTRVLIISLVLLTCGVVFGYIFAIPGALNFLYKFATSYIEASLTADSYLNFIIAYTLGLGLVFQLPLLLMLLHWIKPLTPKGLLKSERWMILMSFIAAAIITPTPDPLNQVIIALPIILIYQLGVAAVLISIHRAKKATLKSAVTQRTQPAQAQHSPLDLVAALETFTPARSLTPTPVVQAQKPVDNTQRAVSSPSYSMEGFGKRRPTTTTLAVPAARTVSVQAPQRPVVQRPVLALRSQLSSPRSGLALDGISRLIPTI